MLKDKTDCSCLVIKVMEDELPFLSHGKKMTLRRNLFQALKDENADLQNYQKWKKINAF